MQYDNAVPGIFVARPNRFIAHCMINHELAVCHVKNTGRCKELLVPGATVYLQKAAKDGRRTLYDLIAVEKGRRLVNLDSQAPNKVFRQWAEAGGIPDIRLIKPECTFGLSRLDFYIETAMRRLFVEVKGVTLEEDGTAMFPDAPTERGIKHMEELCRCVQAGYDAMVVFIIQMKGVHCFLPNDRTHPAFGAALREAERCGVRLLAMDCLVSPNQIVADQPISIHTRPCLISRNGSRGGLSPG